MIGDLIKSFSINKIFNSSDSEDIGFFEKTKNSLFNLKDEIKETEEATDDLSDSVKENFEKASDNIDKASESTEELGTKSKIGAIGIGILKTALKGLAVALISYGISNLVKFIDGIVNADKKIRELAEEAQSDIKNIKSDLDDLINTVDEVKEKYAELSQGVNQFNGTNKSLSTKDYEEFLKLGNQLAKLFPNLSKSYDSNNNAILELNGSTETIIKTLSDLVEAEKQIKNLELEKKFPNFYEGIKLNSKDIKADINTANEDIESMKGTISDLEDIKSFDISDILNGKIYKSKDDLKGKDIVKTIDSYSKLLDSLGIKYKVFSGSEEYIPGVTKVISDSFNINFKKPKNIDDLGEKIDDFIKSLQNDIDNKEYEINIDNIKLDTEWDRLNEAAITWATNNPYVTSMSDDVLVIIQKMINSIDWEELNFDTWEEVSGYIKKNVLDLFILLPNDLQDELTKLFMSPPENLETYIVYFENIKNKIQEYIKNNKLKIGFDIDFVGDDKKDTWKRLKKRISELYPDGEDIMLYLRDKNVNTDFGYENFMSVTQAAKTATEAIEMYEQYLRDQRQTINTDSIFEELDKIKDAYTTVSNAVKEYKDNNKLSYDTVKSLLGLDDKYIEILYDENDQLQLNTDTYKKLAKAKLNELYVDTCYNAVVTLNKLKDEATATDYLKENTNDLVDADWDLVESEMAVAKAKLASDAANGIAIEEREKAINRVYADAENRIKLIQSLMGNIDLDSMFGDGNANGAGNNEFDWIANSISNLNREIETLNSMLDNTDSFEDRIAIYEKLKEANKELATSTAKASKAYESNWNLKSSKISSEYRQRIMSGETFNIESFKDRDEQYNLINEAKQAYDNWKNSQQEELKIRKQIEDIEENRIKLLIEQQQLLLDVNEIQSEEAQTASYKNKLIDEEIEIKKQILDYELSISKTQEERNKLQKEYNKYLNETEKRKYENNVQGYNNKLNYYSSSEKDVQNSISLREEQGLSATEKQYYELIGISENKRRIYSKLSAKALEKRDEQEYGTDLWDFYNEQLQDAEDNINDCDIAIIKYNKDIAAIPINKLEKETEELERQQEIIDKKRNNVSTSISTTSNLVQDEIERQTDIKDAMEDSYDTQIDLIQEKINALSKENELQERQLALEKAKYNLEKAMNQKNVKIYRKGQGFVYEADQDAIRDAEETLDKEKYNAEIGRLNDLKENLEETKNKESEAMEKQIENLNIYKDRLDEITTNWQKICDLQILIATFGSDSVSRIQNLDYSFIDEMGISYDNVSYKSKEIQEKIEHNKTVIDSAQRFIESWNGASEELPDVLDTIAKVISDNNTINKSIEEKNKTIKTVADRWQLNGTEIREELDLLNSHYTESGEEEKEILGNRYENIKEFADKSRKELSSIVSEIDSVKSQLADIINTQIEITTNPKKNPTTKNTKVGQSHTGMELGYIRKNMPDGYTGTSSEGKDAFITLSLRKLDDDELVRILKVGECVLTQEQQNYMLNNMSNSFVAGMNNSPIVIPKTTNSNQKIFEFNGNININNPVGDVNSLAKSIKSEFLIRMDQNLYK